MQVEAERHVADGRLRAAAEAKLQQAVAGARKHGEGARRNLCVEFAGIAGGNAVEGAGAVGDGADEDVDAAGRALGIGGGGKIGWQFQPLLQRHHVDAAGLQHGAARQVERVHDEAVVEPVGDDLLARQEAGAQAVGDLAEAEVEAGRLDLVEEHAALGRDRPRFDDAMEFGVRQHAVANGVRAGPVGGLAPGSSFRAGLCGRPAHPSGTEKGCWISWNAGERLALRGVGGEQRPAFGEVEQAGVGVAKEAQRAADGDVGMADAIAEPPFAVVGVRGSASSSLSTPAIWLQQRSIQAGVARLWISAS